MTHKILLKLLFFTTILLQLSFQQNPNFLSNIIQNVDEATIGYGNQGVIITNEGGNTLDDSLFNFQAVDFEGLGPEEWTVQWIDTEGEAFDLIDENGQILAVGPDSTEDVTDQLASTANIQPAAVSGLIGTLAEDVVQEVDKNGGNMTLTGNQAYSKAVLPVTLAVLGAQSATETVKSGLDQAGNTVKDAAETVGDKASDVANNAWQDTKNAADTVADKASDIGSAIADKATELGENISDGAKDAWEDTKNVAETVGDKVTDAANTVADKATEFGEDVADAAKDAWNGTKDVADKVGDAVTNAVDSLKDGISSLFGN